MQPSPIRMPLGHVGLNVEYMNNHPYHIGYLDGDVTV